MSFTDDVVKEAWKRAGAKCECTRKTHDHNDDRCNKELFWSNRGRENEDQWEAHHIVSEEAGGMNTVSNCEILCWKCHKETL